MIDLPFDGGRPARTIVRILSSSIWPIGLAFVVYAVKHSPVWLLPPLTANIIDVMVERQSIGRLWQSRRPLTGRGRCRSDARCG